MNTYELAAIIAIILILAMLIYFATAKGEKRRITLVASDGSQVAVQAEIANSTATRAKGLMGRASLGEDEGMLFVFDAPGVYKFWMLNTSIPLEAIYVSGNGSVVDIIEMEPCGLNVAACRLYTPSAPAQYVLEVNQNFSKRHGIRIGKSSLLLDS